MKIKLRLQSIAFLLLILAYLNSFPQPVNFQRLSLPGRNLVAVSNVAQDKYGYLWMTTSRGLLRYDGYSFKTYLNDPQNPNSLGENHGELVYPDRNGIIWIANWTFGLDRLDPVTGVFSHFRHDPMDPSSISDDYVRAILEDKEGNLWIGTHGGLDLFNRQTRKVYSLPL